MPDHREEYLMTSRADGVVTPMTAEQRAEFERDGFLVIRGVLSEAEVAFYAGALDRVYQARQAAGAVAPGGAMHLLSAVANCPEAAGLIDHRRVFGLVWSVLGWNIHIYHSHLDVHPPITRRPPFRYEWHQDGGRQNREIETDPRPRLSVKLAFCRTCPGPAAATSRSGRAATSATGSTGRPAGTSPGPTRRARSRSA